MIHTIVLIFHVLACLALVLIVLLQTGRGAEMGAAFGGSSQTLFGSSGGTTFFGKLTTLAAVVFMLTCLGLTYFSGRPDTKSVMEKVKAEQRQVPAPVLPEAKPVTALPAVPAAPAVPTPAPDAAKAEPAAVADKAPASAAPAAQSDKAKGAGAPQAPAKPAAPARKP